MGIYYGSSLVDIAIQIEKNGISLYRQLADKEQNAQIKKLFHQLTEAEEQHVLDFLMLKSNLDEFLQGLESDEFELYFQNLADEHVFVKSENLDELLARVNTSQEAMDLAVSFEKDSILFFSEMRERIRTRDMGVVEELIKQERRHIQDIVQLKNSL